MWTRFNDMSSGGSQKEKWGSIYIEAPLEEAKTIFYNRFGHNPERVTCTCCGDDYSITEGESLEELTAFYRGCRSIYFKGDLQYDEADFFKLPYEQRKDFEQRYLEEDSPSPTFFQRMGYRTLNEFKKGDGVLIISAEEIKPEERQGEVPTQSYIWM